MAVQHADFGAFSAAYMTWAGKLDFRPLGKIVRLQLVSATQKGFADEADPDGMPWEPLKRQRSSKGRAKKKRKTADKILQDTGKLRASMASAFQGPDTALEARREGLSWGTNVEYASYHRYGTDRIPARPFLGINAQAEKDIGDLTAMWVADQLRGLRS